MFGPAVVAPYEIANEVYHPASAIKTLGCDCVWNFNDDDMLESSAAPFNSNALAPAAAADDAAPKAPAGAPSLFPVRRGACTSRSRPHAQCRVPDAFRSPRHISNVCRFPSISANAYNAEEINWCQATIDFLEDQLIDEGRVNISEPGCSKFRRI